MKVTFDGPKTVLLYWEDPHDTGAMWNEACARAVEIFGLPGHRYKTEITADWMKYKFKRKKDALMFVMSV